MEPIRLLSLFSGVGAFEKALANIGVPHELISYCELDRFASLSYSLIHGVDESLNLTDVRKIDSHKLPDFDLMTYGFPCKSFSVCGPQDGFDNEANGDLFFESMRIARAKRPPVLLAENVKNLVGHDRGRTMKVVLETLDSIGYESYHAVLNAADFGLPQVRERVFIVSFLRGIRPPFEFPKGERTHLRARDLLDMDDKDRYVKESLRPYLTRYELHKRQEQNSGLVTHFKGHAWGHFPSGYHMYDIYGVDGMCPTLITKKEQPVFLEVMGEAKSVERFRFMGFSDSDYEKCKGKVTDNQMAIQMGNSIAVSVLEAIFRRLYKERAVEVKDEIAYHIPLGTPSDYQGRTSQCCRDFTLPHSPQHLLSLLKAHRRGEKAPNDIERVYDMLIYLGQYKTEECGHGHHYTCRHLDADTGVCGIYEERPEVCRLFPGDNECQYATCVTRPVCNGTKNERCQKGTKVEQESTNREENRATNIVQDTTKPVLPEANSTTIVEQSEAVKQVDVLGAWLESAATERLVSELTSRGYKVTLTQSFVMKSVVQDKNIVI